MDRNGSHLSAVEQMKAKNTPNRPYTMAGVVDPFFGLKVRVADKIRLAAQYRADNRFDELWFY
jgi:hypothetical protein